MNYAAAWDAEHRKRLMLPSQLDGRVISFVRRLCPKTKPGNVRILDVGCGAGAYTWWMADKGYDVQGIDGSAHAIKHETEPVKARRHYDGIKPLLFVCD